MTCCARRVGFDTLHSQPVEGHRSPTMAYTVRRHRLSSITRAPLPQGDRRARPALAGGAVSGECNRIVLDAGDVFDDAFAVRCPSIDAEGEVSSRRGLPIFLRFAHADARHVRGSQREELRGCAAWERAPRRLSKRPSAWPLRPLRTTMSPPGLPMLGTPCLIKVLENCSNTYQRQTGSPSLRQASSPAGDSSPR